MPYLPRARLALAVELGGCGPRLPESMSHPVFGVPLVRVDAQAASAAARVALALDCALGRVSQREGAFAG